MLYYSQMNDKHGLYAKPIYYNECTHPSIHLQSNRRFPSLPLTSHPLQHFCGNAEVFVNHLRDTISLAPSLPHSWIRQWYSWFPQLWSQTHSKMFWGNVGSRHSESQELCCLGQYAPCRVSQVKLALDWPGGGLDVSILSGSNSFFGCGTVKKHSLSKVVQSLILTISQVK